MSRAKSASRNSILRAGGVYIYGDKGSLVCTSGDMRGIEVAFHGTTKGEVLLRDSLADFVRYRTNALLKAKSRLIDATRLMTTSSRRSPLAMTSSPIYLYFRY